MTLTNLTATIDCVSAADAGLIAENYAPFGLSNQVAIPTAGVINLARVPWRSTRTITNVCYALNTAGATLTAAQNFVGVYDSTGVRKGTSADQSSAWIGTPAFLVTPLTAPVLVTGSPTGFIWVAWVSNGTTRPAIGKAAGTATIFGSNRSVAAALTFHGHILTAQTTLPASITPSSIVADSTNYYAAVS